MNEFDDYIFELADSNRENMENIDKMPSQRSITSSITKSRIASKIENGACFNSPLLSVFYEIDVPYSNYFSMAKLLHSHYAALKYLSGGEPSTFDIEEYKSLVNQSGIKRIMEIGPATAPVSKPLKRLVDTNGDVKVTYIIPEMLNNLHYLDTLNCLYRGDRVINGYFPSDLPIGEKFDLIFACGVFSIGGQGNGHQIFTKDLESIADALSSNSYSVGINIAKTAPSIFFDQKKLCENGSLLFINTPETGYMTCEDGLHCLQDWNGTDIVILKSPSTKKSYT